MGATSFQQSWLGNAATLPSAQDQEETAEFLRVWQGFMIARLALSGVILALQLTLFFGGASGGATHSSTMLLVSAAYFASAVAARVMMRPRALAGRFNLQWLTLVGIDVGALTVFQVLQGATLNYTPVFALPILLASVLGTMRLAVGTAAAITTLLLAVAGWDFLRNSADVTPYFVQSALSGVAFFVVAVLASQLASRLASEGVRARQNQLAARIQRQVNALVIEALPDGILIVDARGAVRAANPAARRLLGAPAIDQRPQFSLGEQPGWSGLLHLTRLCMGSGQVQEDELSIVQQGQGPRRVKVRTSLAAAPDIGTDNLCVLFVQDLRELEAQLRTEKLASMGRLTTAVAHEIRNPLAAISQANALLEEDLADTGHQRLCAMIAQNAVRLDKIVNDILNASRVQTSPADAGEYVVTLNEHIQRVCSEWSQQSACGPRLQVHLDASGPVVRFDGEHLRRVMVNLLDNAARYASTAAGAIQVWVDSPLDQQARVVVWSDAAPMELTVERHLFEPFFSSESRSSGLGLFICRELCEAHGASIHYARSESPDPLKSQQGNAFVVTLLRPAALPVTGVPTTPNLWQPNLY